MKHSMSCQKTTLLPVKRPEAAPVKLTPAQHRFLAGYLPAILEVDPSLHQAERAAFIRRVVEMDFDDGEASPPATHRIARNLKAMGLLSNLDIHEDVLGGAHIYLEFTERGAEALFMVHRKGH